MSTTNRDGRGATRREPSERNVQPTNTVDPRYGDLSFTTNLEAGKTAEHVVMDLLQLTEGDQMQIKAYRAIPRTGVVYLMLEHQDRDGSWSPYGVAVDQSKVHGFSLLDIDGSTFGLILLRTTDLLRVARFLWHTDRSAHTTFRTYSPTRGVLVGVERLIHLCFDPDLTTNNAA